MQSAAVSKGSSTFLNCGILLILPDSLSAQSQKDVHESLLISQLAADKKHDRHDQTRDWQNMFFTTLSKLGWVINSDNFQRIALVNATVDLASLALNEISQGSILKEDVGTFRKAVNFLRKLPNDDDFLQLLYKDRTESSERASIMLAVASSHADGSVVLDVFILSITESVESAKNYLEHIYDSAVLDKVVRSTKMVLNGQQYDGVRKTISHQLEDRDSFMIKEITFGPPKMPNLMPSLQVDGTDDPGTSTTDSTAKAPGYKSTAKAPGYKSVESDGVKLP